MAPRGIGHWYFQLLSTASERTSGRCGRRAKEKCHQVEHFVFVERVEQSLGHH